MYLTILQPKNWYAILIRWIPFHELEILTGYMQSSFVLEELVRVSQAKKLIEECKSCQLLVASVTVRGFNVTIVDSRDEYIEFEFDYLAILSAAKRWVPTPVSTMTLTPNTNTRV